MTPVIELRNIERTYSSGEVEVRAVRGVSLTIEAGGIRRDHGSERLRKIDDDEHARLPRPAHRRHLSAGWHRRIEAQPGRSWRISGTGRSGSFSRASISSRAPRPSRTSSCRCSTPASGSTPGNYGRRRSPRWRSWAWRSAPGITPTSSPAASSSAWRSRARCATNPRCCWPTSRPATWIRQTSIEIMGVFQKLNEEGITIVMVTHELDIAHYTKRNIVMRDGMVVERPACRRPALRQRGIAPARGGAPSRAS